MAQGDNGSSNNGGNENLIEALKKIGKDICDKLQGISGGHSKSSGTSIIIIGALVIGAIFLLGFFPEKEDEIISPSVLTTKEELADDKELSYEEELEIKLEAILAQVEGVGKTDVMITTETFYERELAEETDKTYEQTTEANGGNDTKTITKNQIETSVVMEDGKTPYIIKEYRPEISGVLIIAEGADNASIKEDIVNTVKYLLDVESNQVSVLKKAKN